MEKKYTYDAFISYRHTDLDQFVAENLHKHLESFKLPKSVQKSGKATKTKIERIFRDKDELSLTSSLEDYIVEALEQSEYLIVICSPRLKESQWCQKEIETFIELHGKERVLAVLVEGEPWESFPEQLLYREETVEDENGVAITIKRAVEPLAADVRGDDKKEMLKNMRQEMLRLLAPMFGVSFDDLRQRHRERKIRQIMAASIVCGVLGIGVGIAATATALKIQAQKEEIEYQADEIAFQNQQLIQNQAKNLAQDALDLLSKGDRAGAISLATQALSTYKGIAMPYTAEAKYALTESLYAYDSASYIKPITQLKTTSVIQHIVLSPNGERILCMNRVDDVTVWDVKGNKLATIEDTGAALHHEDSCIFIDNNTIAYDQDGTVYLYDINTQSKKVLCQEYVVELASDVSGDYLAFNQGDYISVYATHSMELLSTFQTAEFGEVNTGMHFLNDALMVYSETVYGKDAGVYLHMVDVETGDTKLSMQCGYSILESAYIKDNVLYVLMSKIPEEGQSSGTAVLALDTVTGTLLWELAMQDEYMHNMVFSKYSKADCFLIALGNRIFLVKEADGTIWKEFVAEGSVVNAYARQDVNCFEIYSEEGDYYYLNVEESLLHSHNYLFQCVTDNNEMILDNGAQLIVLPVEDECVTIYNYGIAPSVAQYSGDVVWEDVFVDNASESLVLAEQLGLPKKNMVLSLIYSEDKSKIFVSYSDCTLEVYQADTMTLIETVEDSAGPHVTRYLGEDQDGNIYVTGIKYGYCFDKDCQLIARIEGLLYMDPEQEALITDAGGYFLKLPIYSTEELVELGKNY